MTYLMIILLLIGLYSACMLALGLMSGDIWEDE